MPIDITIITITTLLKKKRKRILLLQILIEPFLIEMLQLLLKLLLKSIVVRTLELLPMLMPWLLNFNKLGIKMPPLELNIMTRMLKTTFLIDNGLPRTKPVTGLKLIPQIPPEMFLMNMFPVPPLLSLNKKNLWLHLMLLLLKHKQIMPLLLLPKRTELLPQDKIKL